MSRRDPGDRGGMKYADARAMPTRSRFFPIIACALFSSACGSSDDDPQSACPSGAVCDSGTPAGPDRGLRADGTVDITPAEAWPDRGVEPAPLSAEELARACVALAACIEVDPSEGGSEDDTRRLLQAICVRPSQSYFWEERAVPTVNKNERWTFEARAIIAAAGGCQAALTATTERLPEIYCEEVGCWWRSLNKPVPAVSCAGDVATLVTAGETSTRDCSRAFASCDSSSATGCSDRAPVGCEHPAKDRCDGNIRIGCDGTGRVSFHDCARVPGGQCADGPDGPTCVYPDETCPTPPASCVGDALQVCAMGALVDVDCTALGLSGCSDGLCRAN
jgi:hypothetical protein